MRWIALVVVAPGMPDLLRSAAATVRRARRGRSTSTPDDRRDRPTTARTSSTGRAGREHEPDGVLLFLASAASSSVTGQTIPVDDGWTII